jgi:homocysteine S-methyltransferase
VPSRSSPLPQLAGPLFLTDGGIETTLTFRDGIDLPEFAAFPLLDTDEGTAALRRYYAPYTALARRRGLGFVLESPTWRANPDWAARLGYGRDELDLANRRAIALMTELRDEHATSARPFVISGCVGPQSDGYRPASLLSAAEAERYHTTQIGSFADTAVDLVTGVTMTYADEAIGIVRAALAAGLPVVISFTVETDGRLPTGEALGDAIERVDDETAGAAAYFMVNCAHPSHFADVLAGTPPWAARIRGLRANASTKSHAELDEATELDEGDPADLGAWHATLAERLPSLTVVGGCCGTDARHVEAICDAVLSRRGAA